MKIKIFKNSLVQRLKESIANNLELYKSGEFSQWLESEHESEFIEIDVDGVHSIDFEGLNRREGDRVSDDLDVQLFYPQLANLPPSLARDPRLWATFCHMNVLPYIRKRNPQILSGNNEQATNIIQSRFFITGGGRGYERTNALARLWWYGHIANKTGIEFERAVHALVEDTDHRATTIERPSLAVCGNYMKAMTEVLVSFKEKEDDFFNSRDAYRPMMKSVYEMAGRKFFPAMEVDEIKMRIEEQIQSHRK